MKTRIKKRALGIVALSLIFVICLTLALYSAAFFSFGTFSADEMTYAEITADSSQGVDIYISGDGVEWNEEEGRYDIPKNTTVEITVVNNLAVSTNLSVSGGTIIGTSSNNFAEVEVGEAPLQIKVNAQLASERGTSLSTAYSISDSEDLLALSKLLAASDSYGDFSATDSGETFAGYLAEFGLDKEEWYDDNGNFNTSYNTTVKETVVGLQKQLSTSYFRLTDEIMLNASTTDAVDYAHGYFGLGSRRSEIPFAGVFDFNGHAVTMNVVISEASAKNFSSGLNNSGQNILSVGFFNFIMGNGSAACAIIGADIRGTIAVSASLGNISDNYYRLYVGGVAGTIGDHVVLDGVTSRASVTVTASADNTGITVYAGGIFGLCASDIDSWSNVSYIGNYSEVSVTNKSLSNLKYTIVGALAGVIQNSYVNAFTADLVGANILADSTSNGSAIAGGLAGVMYIIGSSTGMENLSERSIATISNIDLNVAGSTISANAAAKDGSSIDEDDITSSKYDTAICGGVLGLVYSLSTSTTDGIYITNINLSTAQGASGALNVRAALADTSSFGVPFAGGIFGYVYTSGGNVNYVANSSSAGVDGKTIFNCDVNVNSTQNGEGPAYAGGIFGYNAFELPSASSEDNSGITFNLNSEKTSITVTAEQSESSGAESEYNVAAGFYTSVLQKGYTIKNFTFNVNNGTVNARRLTGSDAVGDISAGAIAGKATGDGNGSAEISNLTVNLKSCSVNVLGYSFESDLGQGKEGNNVYAGGVIGLVTNYGSGNSTFKLSGITLNFSGTSDYAVRGVQNAVSGNSDYCTEGYVGGMFGMMYGGSATNLIVKGDSRDSALIYFSSTNNPNTACVGGLIGATRVYSGGYSVESSSVSNLHVAGRAYTDVVQDNQSSKHDLFVGGAIGVVGSAISGGTHYIEQISVENTAVESVGEQNMLTYAGGVIGGAWWVATINISNLYSNRNSVLASSASYNTYAGGAIGQMEGTSTINFSNAIVLNTTVEAITYSSSYNAYAAGICGRSMGNTTVTYSISNAVVKANKNGSQGTVAGISIKNHNNVGSYNYFVAANVMVDSIDNAYAVRNESGTNLRGGSNYAIALTGSGQNNTSSGTTSYTFNYASGSVDIYTSSPSSSEIAIVGESVTLSGNTVSAKEAGTSFAQLYINTSWGDLLLCSYPITVVSPSLSGNVGLTTPDFTDENGDNASIDENNTRNYYYNNGEVTYFQIYAGESEKVQNVILTDTNVYTPTLYLVTSNLYGYEGSDELVDVVSGIIQNKGNSVSSKDLSDYFYFTAGSDGKSLYVSPVLGNTSGAALVLEYNLGDSSYYYVIIEVVPNAVTSITVAPAEDTPARAQYTDGNDVHYVYAPGDTVRLEATISYLFSFNRYIVDVTYSGSATNFSVKPNGTVIIETDAASGSSILITCKEINGTNEAKVYIDVQKSISIVSDEMTGASYSPQGNKNAVIGYDFTFYLDPNPGYGLNPSLTFVLNTGATWTVTFPEEREDVSSGSIYIRGVNGETYVTMQNGSITYESQPTDYSLKLTYSFDAESGRYTITIPKEVFSISGLSEIKISAKFERVYSIMFDLGQWAQGSDSDADSLGTRYFIYTVKTGTVLNTDLRNSIFSSLSTAFDKVFARKGFTFMGFYTTNYTSSLSGYGTSFYDTCEVGEETVHGAINYYARWNYTAVLNAPEGIGIESALSSNLIDRNANENNNNTLIPIDTEHGFSFRITGDYKGTPRVEIYTVVSGDDGSNSLSALDFTAVNGVYTITDPDAVSGTIYVYVYGDNIAAAVGEEDTDSAFTSSISLREDGIFTVRYAVNYGSGGATALGESAEFDFGTALPAGTDIRLFYQVNGSPVCVGEYEVGTGGESKISAGSFTALTGSANYSYSGTVYSEVYYLVITLPNNADNFSVADLTVSVTTLKDSYPLVTLVSTEYSSTGMSNNGTSQDKVQKASRQAAESIKTDITLYSAVIRGGSYSNGTLTFTANDSATDAPSDVRHNGKYYVWRITGENLDISTDATVVKTDSAVYIVIGDSSVTSKEITLTLKGGKISEIVLMEVTNPQYPAAGTIIANVYSQSGN